MGLAAGRLRHKVEIYKKTTTQTESGATVDSWELYSERRATVSYKNGKEVVENSEIFNTQQIEVFMRSNGTIKEQDRLKYDGRTYEIDFIEKSFDRSYMKIKCTLLNE